MNIEENLSRSDANVSGLFEELRVYANELRKSHGVSIELKHTYKESDEFKYTVYTAIDPITGITRGEWEYITSLLEYMESLGKGKLVFKAHIE